MKIMALALVSVVLTFKPLAAQESRLSEVPDENLKIILNQMTTIAESPKGQRPI